MRLLKWAGGKSRARMAAAALLRESAPAPLILLGAKVCAAFGLAYEPFTCVEIDGPRQIAILPHPSGLSHAWHVPGAYQRARDVVRELQAVLA